MTRERKSWMQKPSVYIDFLVKWSHKRTILSVSVIKQNNCHHREPKSISSGQLTCLRNFLLKCIKLAVSQSLTPTKISCTVNGPSLCQCNFIMGKTVDLTGHQQPQKVIAKQAGTSQTAAFKHIKRKSSRRKKLFRKSCISAAVTTACRFYTSIVVLWF